jgi:hypothetical protein
LSIGLVGCVDGPAREGNFDRTFSVSGKVMLSVEDGAGNIVVHPGTDQKVIVNAHIRARGSFTGMSSEEKVKRITANPPITQSGSTIRITRPSDSELTRNVFIDYDITAPAQSQVSAFTGAGKIDIRGMQASVEATSGAGAIIVEDLSDDARVHTGAGNIDVRTVRGRVDAESGAGRITVRGEPQKDWRVTTGAGSIKLELPPDASLDLDAETGMGRVNLASEFQMKDASVSTGRVHGTMGKGGPSVKITNGAGSIEIARGTEQN